MVHKKIQKSPVLIYIIPMVLQRKLKEAVLIVYPRSQNNLTAGSLLVLNEGFEIIRTASGLILMAPSQKKEPAVFLF
jgi:hypothetical protein